MPNKTIYIRDTDAEVWERAEFLAKARDISMSALIIQALKLFTEPRLK